MSQKYVSGITLTQLILPPRSPHQPTHRDRIPNTILSVINSMDLTLPSTCPGLGVYGKYSWSNASFALYTLISTSQSRMQEIATTLDTEWYEGQGNEGSHLVRVAPVHNFANKSLSDILEVHVKLDKVAPGQGESQYGALDLEWYPTAFVVVTAENLDDKGLLLVYVDDEVDEDDEVPEYTTDKFFFKQKDANSMLSSLAYDDDTAARSKDKYGYD